MSDISANRTDLMDSSRQPGELPASTQGQVAKRQAQAAALPPMQRRPVLGPSTRPSEPVTAGLPIGAGPSARPLPGRRDNVLEQMRGLLAVSRDPMLALLISRIEEKQ